MKFTNNTEPPADNEIRKSDNNLLRFHGDAATTAVEDAAVNYQAPSIIAAGADAHGVAVLTTVINLSLALVCFKAPTLIEKAGLAKRGGIILAFLNLLAWVPLTVAFLLSRLGITSGWFALLWFINIVPGMLLSFQRDNWLSNLIPHGNLGRYLGQRLAIKSAFYLGAFFILGYILDKFGKDNLAGFAIIFTIAIAVGLIDFIIFTFMSDKNKQGITLPQAETGRFGLHEYFGELKEKKLDTFILFTTFFYLTVGLSGPLYAVFMLNELHFTYLSYTMIISAEYLARVISAPFWGRYADKAGNIKILGIVARVIPLLPIFWIFFHNLGYLVFVQIISGTCWGAFDLSTQSYLYKVAPAEKKLRYIVYTRCLILLCTAMGGLLGAFCVDSIFPTFGSRILSVLWISGVSRAIVVLFMMPKIVDLAVSFGKLAKPPEITHEIMQKILNAKRGKFYHREKEAQGAASPILNPGEAASAADISLYAGKRKWAKAEKKKKVSPELIPVVKAEKINLRLDHYREAMSAMADLKTEIIQHGMGQNIERVKLRFGVERRPEPLIANVAGNEALVRHEIEQNMEKLTARFKATAEGIAKQRPVTVHEIQPNMERLQARFNPAQELATISAARKEALTHHEMDMEKLKARFNPAVKPIPLTVSAVRKEAIAIHHEIDMDRLAARFNNDRRTELTGVAGRGVNHTQLKKEEIRVRPNAGLFQNQGNWGRYMKDTLDSAFREMQGAQQVPVPVNREV